MDFCDSRSIYYIGQYTLKKSPSLNRLGRRFFTALKPRVFSRGEKKSQEHRKVSSSSQLSAIH